MDGPRSQKSVRKRSSKVPQATYSEIAHQYARDVVSGKVIACLFIRQACQRHLDDLCNAVKRKFPYRFDDAKANFVCRFLEHLPHVKGEWARPRPGHSVLLKLEPWQVFKTCCIFGWVEKATGLRKFTEVYDEEPRKQAKSTWAAGIGLFMMAADGEYGAEVYCGATTERQAMEVFRTALQMARRSPEFELYFGVEHAVKSIYREEDASRFVPVVGNPGDGASPSCAILDEVHEHPSPVLIDTMRTGMGARSQPLLICITTAGSNLSGPCYAMRLDAQKVLAKQLDNPNLFALIYTIDADDDWKSPASLRKANPNFGVSVKPEFLERELRKAIQSAHLQNIFKTKHLNIWVGAAAGWMNMDAWSKCADPELKLEDFIGQPCYEGDDLAARIDLASRMKLYKKLVGGQVHYYAFGRHYVPRDTAMDGEHADYAAWVHQGYLVAHDGPEIQLSMIEAEIDADIPKFNFACIAFDQYSAQQMQQSLEKKVKEGVVITIPQTVQHLSEPMKEIEAAVVAGRFHHDGDPVLTWAMSNVVVRVDANDNIFPRKEQPDNKIDPVSALINAMNRAYVAPATAISIYETRGMLIL
jgi:phage terminase large subunit-like protein